MLLFKLKTFFFCQVLNCIQSYKDQPNIMSEQNSFVTKYAVGQLQLCKTVSYCDSTTCKGWRQVVLLVCFCAFVWHYGIVLRNSIIRVYVVA